MRANLFIFIFLFGLDISAQNSFDTIYFSGREYVKHIVKGGESLRSIATLHKVKTNDIILANEISKRLFYNQLLYIPVYLNSTDQELIPVKDLVLEDYAQGKAQHALDVWKSDIKIDSSYANILSAILEDIKEKPEAIEALVPLFFIARYLERIGDQATNIAEVTHFIVTGETLGDDRKMEVEDETVF